MKNSSKPVTSFPHHVRRNIKNTREYDWFSKAARDKKWDEEDEILSNVVSVSSDYSPRCFGLTRNTIIDSLLNEECAESIQIGFDSLVRVAIQNKADFLSQYRK